MSNFHVPPRRRSGKLASKYGFYAHLFSEADLRMLDRGLEAQTADLEELFHKLAERYEKQRDAGELSASQYLEVRQALNNAQESLRSLRRTLKEERDRTLAPPPNKTAR
jgi:hypothetical protein